MYNYGEWPWKSSRRRHGFDIGNYINEMTVTEGVKLGTLRIPGQESLSKIANRRERVWTFSSYKLKWVSLELTCITYSDS